MFISELIEKLTATQNEYGDLSVFVCEQDGYVVEFHDYKFMYPPTANNPWIKDVTLPPYGILFDA